MAGVLCAFVALLVLAFPMSASAADQTRAGVASVDATWHVGASAGQFTDEGGVAATPDSVDPHTHVTKKRRSDGVALRTSTRALVVEDAEGDRVAVVSTDLYLPQDFLQRRVASLLAGTDTGINGQNLAMTASHNHNTPYYSTPGWGTAIFQDVFDLRFYDYMARRMAKAVIDAANDMVPVRMGGATRTFNEIQSHTYGPQVGDDGTPAGQPYDHTTKQLSVVRFDDISDPDSPQPLANWVVFGVHPEWTWGYDLINGDITMAAARMVDRELGTTSVFSQRETGTSGPHKDTRVHQPAARREFQDNGFGQLDRGARLLADGIKQALSDIENGSPQHPEAYQPYIENFDVGSVSQRFAPPKTRPYPGVSNCNTMSLFHGDPRVPIAGLPDCEPANEYGFQPVTDIYRPHTSPMYDQLKAAGVPVPESYSPTKLTAVEETNAVHLMAMRFGDVVATFCPCEQFTDTALNIQSRLDRVPNNIWKGYDWADQKTPSGRDWCVPAPGETWTCANPKNPNSDLAPIDDETYRRFRAQIHNDATGWADDLATLGSESEPKDPSKIKGNFTHEEFPQHGYKLALSVGMANDYWGYVPEYREYRSHDHYRKALSGLGPHGADFLATRLARLGASLNGGPGPEITPLDQAFLAEQARAEGLAVGLGELATAYTAVYEKSLPADGGSPAITQQPAGVKRFSAAHLRFVGGSNYTDLPDVRVEHKVGDSWEPFGDEHGDVQLMVDWPAPDELDDWRSGSYTWRWTASFEAFSSDISQPDASGVSRKQTPAGIYRFVVDGRHRPAVASDGQAYHLESEPFEVSPWDGLTAQDLRVEEDGRVSFAASSIDYPDSYASPFRFINAQRRTLAGGQVYCSRCSFRPWADFGELAEATITISGPNGTRTAAATRGGDGRWRTSEALASGESARIEAGDLRDTHGETNGSPSTTVSR